MYFMHNMIQNLIKTLEGVMLQWNPTKGLQRSLFIVCFWKIHNVDKLFDYLFPYLYTQNTGHK